MATNSTPALTSALTKKMLDEVLFDDVITKLPEPSVVVLPNIVGCAVVASNNVTLTLASGWVEVVPPVWTTPFSKAALADGTTHSANSIPADASTSWVVVKIKLLMEIPLTRRGFKRKYDMIRAKKSALRPNMHDRTTMDGWSRAALAR